MVMSTSQLKEKRALLVAKKEELQALIAEVDKELTYLDNMEKPYVACVQSYGGGGGSSFKTLAEAEKRLEQYQEKKYYRNGLNYGVYLYKHLEDGSKKMLKVIPLQKGHFREPDLTIG